VLAKRKASRSRSETAPEREQIKTLAAELREIKFRLAERRKELRANNDLGAARQAIEDRCRERSRWSACEAAIGSLRWGTYQLVQEAVGRAGQAPLWASEDTPADPRFSRWRGEGQVSEQFIKGIAPDGITTHTQAQIDPVPPETWTGTRAQRRRLSR